MHSSSVFSTARSRESLADTNLRERSTDSSEQLSPDSPARSNLSYRAGSIPTSAFQCVSTSSSGSIDTSTTDFGGNNYNRFRESSSDADRPLCTRDIPVPVFRRIIRSRKSFAGATERSANSEGIVHRGPESCRRVSLPLRVASLLTRSGRNPGMLDRLHQVIQTGEPSGQYRECRRCGRAVDDDAEQCSACGSGDVASYSF